MEAASATRGVACDDPEWVDHEGQPFSFTRSDYNMFFMLDRPELPGDNVERVDALSARDLPLTVTRGAIPTDLVGSYYLNGPSMIKLAGRVAHPFDGHGFLRRISLDGAAGTARLTAGPVATVAFQREHEARRLTYRGLGTLVADPSTLKGRFDNLRSSMSKNVANTCVQKWAGSLLCLWEGGPPHRVNEDDFAAPAQVHTFDGAISTNIPFLAHTRVDARRGRLVGLNLFQGRNTGYTFLEFGADNEVLAKVRQGTRE
jgi:carotenoid cleavage dioxygenase-like enzyme